MLIIGGPKRDDIREDDTWRWALFIIYAFLMNVVNMKLLISMIGETFQRHQVSRVHMGYNMKVNYLLAKIWLDFVIYVYFLQTN